jgi:Acetyltransferase (GNAT) domain
MPVGEPLQLSVADQPRRSAFAVDRGPGRRCGAHPVRHRPRPPALRAPRLSERRARVTHVGELRPRSGHAAPRSRPATVADLPGILELDGPVFGADRARLLRALPAFADRLRVTDGNGRIRGYAGAWRNDANTVIGPVVAETDAEARALIADVAAGVSGPDRLDLDELRPELGDWAAASGAEPAFETTIMVYGGDLPGDSSRLFLPVMQALG